MQLYATISHQPLQAFSSITKLLILKGHFTQIAKNIFHTGTLPNYASCFGFICFHFLLYKLMELMFHKE